MNLKCPLTDDGLRESAEFFSARGNTHEAAAFLDLIEAREKIALLKSSLNSAGLRLLLAGREMAMMKERRIPNGWKLVPEEPTAEMLAAADLNHNDGSAHDQNLAEVSKRYFTARYKAMLAAAPEAEKLC